MKKVLLLFIVLLFLIVFVIYFQNKDPGVEIRLAGESYMNDVSIKQREDGETKWILDAKRAVFISDTDIKLDDLRITFPKKDLILTSDGGMYDIESRNLTIDGNIKASTDDYDIVATTLLWNSSKSKLFSDEKVKIIGENFFVEGDNLIATVDKIKLSNNVRAIFYGKNKENRYKR